MNPRLAPFLHLFNTRQEGLPSAYEIYLYKGSEAPLFERFGAEQREYDHQVNITYQETIIARLAISGLDILASSHYAAHFAPLLRGGMAGPEAILYNLRVLEWVDGARSLALDICNWIGVYYKASFLNAEDSTDLVLGPYVGATTEHERIALSQGFCGMALREERTINIADVNSDDTHIACSPTTRSELVIPLKNEAGELIAELDIDSDQLGAFTPEVQRKFEVYADTFKELHKSPLK